MSDTLSIELQPGEWSILGFQASIQMMQVRGQQSVRLHFGDVREPPNVDAEEYIVTQDYNPQPFNFAPFAASYEEAVVYAMPDGDEPVLVVVVYGLPASRALSPKSGILRNGVVGKTYDLSFYGQNINTNGWTFTVTNGDLPSGLTLNTSGYLHGTATSVGDFAFTVQATDGETLITETYSLMITAS